MEVGGEQWVCIPDETLLFEAEDTKEVRTILTLVERRPITG